MCVTIQDLRNSMRKITNNPQRCNLLENLSDDELINIDVRDLHMISGQVESIIRQLGIDKNLNIPCELHKVLPDTNVKSIINIVNLNIKEEEKMGINV